MKSIATQKQVRTWMSHNFEYYDRATELAEAANVEFNLPDGAMDDETHWIWDEAFKFYEEREDDFDRDM